jgi:hypothetical protein
VGLCGGSILRRLRVRIQIIEEHQDEHEDTDVNIVHQIQIATTIKNEMAWTYG